MHDYARKKPFLHILLFRWSLLSKTIIRWLFWHTFKPSDMLEAVKRLTGIYHFKRLCWISISSTQNHNFLENRTSLKISDAKRCLYKKISSSTLTLSHVKVLAVYWSWKSMWDCPLYSTQQDVCIGHTARHIFMPGLKGPPGHLVIGSSVCLSFHLSVRLSVRLSVLLTHKVQYLKFGWWYSHLNLDCKFIYGYHILHWHHMPLGGGAGSKCRT